MKKTLLSLLLFAGTFSIGGNVYPQDSEVFFDGFGENTRTFSSDEEIIQWLSTDLHAELNLGPADELMLSEQSASINNFSIHTVQQNHQGYPVVGFQSRLILDAQGNQLALLGQHQAFPEDTPSEASVSIEDAITASGLSDTSFSSDTPVYMVVDDELRLSWQLEGNSDGASGATQERIFVDALNGEVIASYPMVYTALIREVGDMEAACRAAGITFPLDPQSAFEIELMVEEEQYHRSEGEASSGAGHVDELYDTLGDAYEFMSSVLGMDSLDDNGLRLKAIAGVHYFQGDPWNQCVGDSFNAMWSSQWNELYIPEVAIPFIEVVAHELAHGIVSNGSDLVYEFESGAMDEAISDAIGVSFRAWRDAGGRMGSSPTNIPTYPALWELRSDTGPLRSMSNPKSVNSGLPGGYPDHYNQFFDLSIEEDQGGVHINSSIINQAFYILVEGGQHPRLGTGPNVQGIGIANASQIFALAGSQLLTPFADFQAGRNAFALAAEILHGKHSEIWIAVHEAMDAVGIPGSWQRQPPTPPPVILPTPVPQPDPAPPSAPDPAPAPDTQAPDPGPVSTPAPGNPPLPSEPLVLENNNALYIGLGIGFLVIAFLVLSRLRPQYSANAPEYRRASAEPARPTPATAPEPRLNQQQIAVSRGASLGKLVGSGTSASIALDDSLLASREGLVIGRSAKLNHVILDDSRVSRRHARLRKEGHLIVLEDLNSTHGTAVNGKKLQPFSQEVIRQGDSVEIAGIRFTCDLS